MIATIFRCAVVFLALQISAVPVFAQCEKDEIVIKLGTPLLKEGSARNRAAKALRDAINKEMQTRACLQLLSIPALYRDELVMEAVVKGSVNLAVPSFTTLSDVEPTFRIFDVPFTFSDIFSLEAFQRGRGGKTLSDALARQGLQSLGFLHNSTDQLSSKKRVTNPADVQGLKIRLGGGFFDTQTVRALRATAQSIAESETEAALRDGRLDAQASSWSLMQERKIGDVQTALIETSHRFTGYNILAQRKWWNELDAKLRTDLTALIARISNTTNSATLAKDVDVKNSLMRSKSAVYALTRKQRAEWNRVLQPVWQQFLAPFPNDLKNDLAKAVKEANSQL